MVTKYVCSQMSKTVALTQSLPWWFVYGYFTLTTLLSTTVDKIYKHLYNQFLKVKYPFNLETLIYAGT